MEHDEAVLRIPELAAGTLDGDEREAVEAHVAACERCRALLETGGEVSAALVRDGPGEHLPSEVLTAWALGSDDLPPAAARKAAEHAVRCPACREEAEAVRRAAAETSAPAGDGSTERRRVTPEWLLLAAAVVIIAVLVVPAWHGLNPPTAGGEDRALAEPVPEGAGRLARLTVLRPPQRATGERVAEIVEAADRGVVPLALTPLLPPDAAADAPVVVTVRGAEGEPAFRARMTVAEAEREVGPSGVLLLLVPAERLPPGDYELAFAVGRDGEPETLWTAPFRVRR
jgi:hypothetical protein